MTTFNYRAVDNKGKDKRGVVQAESPRHARQKLRELGLIVSHISAIKDGGTAKRTGLFSFRKPMSSLELSLLTRQFAILLNSGLSVEQSLNALIDQLDSPTQKSIMMGVRGEILSGRSLAASMKMFPKVFPIVYCSLIHAGEQSGSLANVMTKLAEYSDRTRELTSKIIMALLYPIIVTVVATLMIVALLVYVVPQVVKVFESSKQELPFLTKALIATSNGLRSYGWIILLAIIIATITIFRMLKKHEFKLKFHKKLLELPIAGRLLINIDVARFAHTLSLLLTSGVPMISALEAGRDTVNNYMMKNAINRALKAVQEGVPLAVALGNEKAFPPVVIHLIASGEKSGNLDKLLAQAGAHQELELTHRSQLLTGILEPALILFMGGVVLLIVIAILLPILNMNNLVG
ncbi:MAG: type II secretion system inner membrane protein GspF [Proteobacteria bacterium]|jgi:general secretion pathway protein F|nr:type II secretion system inner membrane protein GspF [Pseudomonadota bacterium]